MDAASAARLNVVRRLARITLLGAAALALALLGAVPTPPLATHAATSASCGSPTVSLPTDGPAALRQPVVTAAINDAVGRIDAARGQAGVAGLSVAVVYDQSVVFAAGFGCADIEQQRPATPQTIYQTGGLSETLTATMMMQLRDAGWFGLDDQLSGYLPDAAYLDASGATVSPTFRQLATHTSGLPPALATVPPSVDALFQQLQTTAANSEPGDAYLYSKLDYAVLGNALARIAGTTYEQYVSSYILQPLGMADSGFDVAASDPTRLATGYAQLQATGGAADTAVAATSRGAFAPADGLLSSANDLAKFLELQFNDNSPVLSAASRQEMYQPVVAATASDAGPAADGVFAGLGWFNLTTNPIPFVYADGAPSGFSAMLELFPQAKLGLVVLENSDNSLVGGAAAPNAIANIATGSLVPALASALGAP